MHTTKSLQLRRHKMMADLEASEQEILSKIAITFCLSHRLVGLFLSVLFHALRSHVVSWPNSSPIISICRHYLNTINSIDYNLLSIQWCFTMIKRFRSLSPLTDIFPRTFTLTCASVWTSESAFHRIEPNQIKERKNRMQLMSHKSYLLISDNVAEWNT